MSSEAKSVADEPKADGPDNMPGRVQKDCAEKLKDVLTDIFNIFLSLAVVPMCFRAATITPP